MNQDGTHTPRPAAPDPEEHSAETGDDFRVLVETVNDGISVIAKDATILYVNPQIARMIGIDRDTVPGLPFHHFLDQEEAERLKAYNAARVSGKPAPDHYEARVLSATGREMIWEIKATFASWKGQPATIAVIRDVTERKAIRERLIEERDLTTRLRREVAHRKEMESALRASEARYRNLLEGTDLIIVQLDSRGRFRFANTAAGRALGMRPEEIVGRRMEEIFPGESARNIENIRQALSTGQPVVTQDQFTIRDRKLWFEARILPLRFPGAAEDEVLVVIDEIHERKLAEARILAYQQQLRTLAAELSLTEQRERRRMAVELHDRIGQQLALSRIRLGTLREALKEPAYATILKEVREALDVSIRDTRSLVFELSPPVLYELGLAAALEWLAEEFGRRHSIRIDFLDDSESKPLDQDLRDLMFHSARELLVNAIKHSDADSIRMRMRRAGSWVELIVSDNGTGFDPDMELVDGKSRTGFGLFSIRERLAPYGGALIIGKGSSGGTDAVLRAPVPEGTDSAPGRIPAGSGAEGGEPS